MPPALTEAIERTIAAHVPDPAFRTILESFVADKMTYSSTWADLVRYTHRMLGGNSLLLESICALAELVMLAGDIADDLQDGDNPSRPWMMCPPGYAINAVMALLTAVYGELGRLQDEHPHEPLPRVSLVAKYVQESLGGQFTDIARPIEDETEYIAMVQAKSGALLRLVCYMGAACCAAIPASALETLDTVAGLAGVMAQIENDAQDVLRLDEKSDILRKKRTLPVLFLLSDPEDTELSMIRAYYEGSLPAERLLAEQENCLQAIRDSGCLDYCRIIVSLHADKAAELLADLPADPEAKAEFMEAMTISRLPSAGLPSP